MGFKIIPVANTEWIKYQLTIVSVKEVMSGAGRITH